MDKSSQRAHGEWADPEVVLALDSLELRARIIVEGFLSGLHKSPFHGFSAEFSEYRPYSPGDDLRYLDWKLLSRTDRRYVKCFEDETNLRCQLLVDLSESMSFGLDRQPKSEYAITLAATFARFLTSQHDAVGLVTFADEVLDFVPARYRPGHLRRLYGTLERATAGRDTGLVPSLERVAGWASRRGVVVLVSDLLTPVEGLETALGQLRARGQEVIVFRVLDPAEIDFPFERASMFEDAETGRQIFVDPASSRDEYRSRFDSHQRALEEICARQGIDMVLWRTDRSLSESLVEYVRARSRRGRAVRRRTRGGAR